MEHPWSRQALDPPGSETGSVRAPHPTEAGGHADDPLGDEAAFPSTWQSLAGLETAAVD